MNNRLKSFIAMGLTAIIWSNAFMHIKRSLEVVGPFSLIFYRFLVAFVVLTIYQRVAGIQEQIDKKDLPRVFINCILGSVIYYGISNLTTTYLPAVDSATLSSMQLILMLWFESMFLQTLITPKKAFYVVIATIGGILLMRLVSISTASMISYNLMILATSLWAAYYIIQLPLVRKYRSTTIIKYQSLYTVILMAPFIFIENNHIQQIADKHVLSILYLGIFGIAIAYSFNTYSLGKIGPTNTSLMLIFQPVIILMMDYFQKNRLLVVTDYIGLVLICTGFILMLMDLKKNKDEHY